MLKSLDVSKISEMNEGLESNNPWGLDEEVFEEEEIETMEDHDDDDEDDEEELDDSTEIPDTASYSVYRRKYNLLLERVNAIEQDNELLVSRVSEVKKLWKKSLRERRLIINKLDTYNDNFRNVQIVLPHEEEPSKKLKDKKLKKGAAEEGGSGGSGRGRKSKADKVLKDPNLPKRPQNPFFQFCKEKRDEVSQEVLHSQGVNLTKKELTKILANQWNSLDNDEKQVS